MTKRTSWAPCVVVSALFGLQGTAAAEEFKVVKIIPATAYVGMRVDPPWTTFPNDPGRSRSISMAEIGDPVLLTLEKRLAVLEARQRAAAEAEAAAQAEPPLPEPAVEQPEDSEPVVVVGILPPGYRGEAPWSYQPRSQRYTGTRAPRYYQTPPVRYYNTQRPRSYTRRPARPWGYQASREVYGYTIRQLRQIEQQLSGQLEQFERRTTGNSAGAVIAQRVARRWANR